MEVERFVKCEDSKVWGFEEAPDTTGSLHLHQQVQWRSSQGKSPPHTRVLIHTHVLSHTHICSHTHSHIE